MARAEHGMGAGADMEFSRAFFVGCTKGLRLPWGMGVTGWFRAGDSSLKIEVELIYSVVLVSNVQQSDSVMYIIYIQHICCYKHRI